MQNPEYFSTYTFGYENVIGWLTTEEAEELTRLATDKTVMEVGTFCGRSALAMARTARKIYCVDHFVGYPATASLNIRDTALGNFDRARVWDKLVLLKGAQEDVIPQMNLQGIEMVFYDADHSFEATWGGVQLLHDAGLPYDATIAFHDADEPGVKKAVDTYEFHTGRHPRMVGSLAIFDGAVAEKPVRECYRIMLCIPHGGSMCYGASQALFRSTETHSVGINPKPGASLMCNQFNALLCDALNEFEAGNITHMVFLHSDIAPEDYWIDTLVQEMEKHGADFLSVVSPIKDNRGLTSCGIGQAGWAWSPKKRFTMHEIMELPETFSIADTGYPEDVLLHNSGCWIADLRNPLFTRTSPSCGLHAFFTQNDRIVRHNGKWRPNVESEDWFFSRRLYELGAKSFITRKVKLRHIGDAEFRNDVAWGEWEFDRDTKDYWGNDATENVS